MRPPQSGLVQVGLWRGFPEGVTLFRVTLEELSVCDRGCRFGLLGCGLLCWLGRGLLGVGLLGLISLLLDSADLHAAFQDCSILYAGKSPSPYRFFVRRSLMEPVGLSVPFRLVRRRATEEILRAERYQATAYAP